MVPSHMTPKNNCSPGKTKTPTFPFQAAMALLPPTQRGSLKPSRPHAHLLLVQTLHLLQLPLAPLLQLLPDHLGSRQGGTQALSLGLASLLCHGESIQLQGLCLQPHLLLQRGLP